MGFTRKLLVAKEGEIGPGTARGFRFGVQNGIAYNDEGALKAYVNFCTHAGGPLELVNPTLFRCRWHEAEFNPKTGERLCGQAPEGTKLKPIELVNENGNVYAVLVIKDEFE
ncbi:MAG: Rieske 2Fe-2S domain-containing protein [Patescibacteria group bacterium]